MEGCIAILCEIAVDPDYDIRKGRREGDSTFALYGFRLVIQMSVTAMLTIERLVCGARVHIYIYIYVCLCERDKETTTLAYPNFGGWTTKRAMLSEKKDRQENNVLAWFGWWTTVFLYFLWLAIFSLTEHDETRDVDKNVTVSEHNLNCRRTVCNGCRRYEVTATH